MIIDIIDTCRFSTILECTIFISLGIFFLAPFDVHFPRFLLISDSFLPQSHSINLVSLLIECSFTFMYRIYDPELSEFTGECAGDGARIIVMIRMNVK